MLLVAGFSPGAILVFLLVGPATNLASLVVRVTQKNDRIRVDVQTRTGASYSTMTSTPQESTVLEFFHVLDLRLLGGDG